MKKNLEKYIPRILSALKGEEVTDGVQESFIVNMAESADIVVHGVTLRTSVTQFGDNSVRVDIDFWFPEGSVHPGTFADHCAAIEKTKKNRYGEYCAGPCKTNGSEDCRRAHTFAYIPRDSTMFYVRSEEYPVNRIEEAVSNAIELATQFSRHLADIATLRYWTAEDEEVKAKAREIIEKADLRDTDLDRETRSHYLRDENSFMHGWFNPFNDRGRGTFDTLWPSSLDYAARGMGLPGSFEYAVASVLLVDREFIAKARKSCHIRKETVTVVY